MSKADIKKPTVQKPGAAKTLKFAEKGKSKSGQIPDGDVRLTANIKEELHTRLKIEAAKQRISIGDLVEELIEANIPKM